MKGGAQWCKRWAFALHVPLCTCRSARRDDAPGTGGGRTPGPLPPGTPRGGGRREGGGGGGAQEGAERAVWWRVERLGAEDGMEKG